MARFFWWWLIATVITILVLLVLLRCEAHAQPIEPPLHQSIAWYLTPSGPLVVVYFQEGKFVGYEHTLVGMEPAPAVCREKRSDGEFWFFSTESTVYRTEPGPVNRFHVREFCEPEEWDPETKSCRVAP